MITLKIHENNAISGMNRPPGTSLFLSTASDSIHCVRDFTAGRDGFSVWLIGHIDETDLDLVYLNEEEVPHE